MKALDILKGKETKPVRDDGAWAILFNDEHKFLIAKRSPCMRHRDLWNFFGGGINKGENSIQAALRELREETRLRFNPTDAIQAEILVTPERTHNFFVFDYKGEKIRLNWESCDSKWVTVVELKGMLDQLHKPTRLFVESFL
jgi:8-oxo-dGTP pyrophosphatase MutT (NUDIX family)